MGSGSERPKALNGPMEPIRRFVPVDPQTKKAGIRLQSTFEVLCEYRPIVFPDRSGGLAMPMALASEEAPRACPIDGRGCSFT